MRRSRNDNRTKRREDALAVITVTREDDILRIDIPATRSQVAVGSRMKKMGKKYPGIRPVTVIKKGKPIDKNKVRNPDIRDAMKEISEMPGVKRIEVFNWVIKIHVLEKRGHDDAIIKLIEFLYPGDEIKRLKKIPG